MIDNKTMRRIDREPDAETRRYMNEYLMSRRRAEREDRLLRIALLLVTVLVGVSMAVSIVYMLTEMAGGAQ